MFDGNVLSELGTQGVGHGTADIVMLVFIVFGPRGRRRPLARLEITIIRAVLIFEFPPRPREHCRRLVAAGNNGGSDGGDR